ncbi:C-type lectin 37Db-like [Haematobia irritans]|uniref:C-type lectin 37Db-like n=1 Tax=Haematobia irritans TaxID=7368 RepID=UPI003F4F88E7
MLLKISTICLIASFVTINVLAVRPPKIQTTVLEAYPDEIDVTPFTKVGRKLYHFGQSKVSWFKANLICRTLGGYLASFDTQAELTALSDHLKANYPTDRWWWLSGSDLHGEGDFHWYRTGERLTYADWSAGQPDNAGGNEHCVHLWFVTNKFQMNDWICNQAAYYICEADKPNTVVVSIF